MVNPRPVPPILACGGRVGLSEWLKKPRHLVRPYPDACIGDAESYHDLAVIRALQAGFERDLSALRELDGVGREIRQYLPQAPGIAAHRKGNGGRNLAGELQALRFGLGCQKLDHLVDGVAQVEGALFQGDFARLDLGKVENVVDERQQGLPAGSAPRWRNAAAAR